MFGQDGEMSPLVYIHEINVILTGFVMFTQLIK